MLLLLSHDDLLEMFQMRMCYNLILTWSHPAVVIDTCARKISLRMTCFALSVAPWCQTGNERETSETKSAELGLL